MYRYDHNTALIRIDDLERDHDRLENELAQLRGLQPSPEAEPPPEHADCDCKICRDHAVVVRQTLIAFAVLGLLGLIVAGGVASYS